MSDLDSIFSRLSTGAKDQEPQSYDDFLAKLDEVMKSSPSASGPLPSAPSNQGPQPSEVSNLTPYPKDPIPLSQLASFPDDQPPAEPSVSAPPPEIAQALIGAATPSNPSVPSKNIQGPDTPITAPASNPASSPFDYGKGLSAQDLVNAQEQQRQNNMGVGIFQSLAQGLGQATGAKPSDALYQNLHAEAGAPVQNILQRRAGEASSIKMASDKLALQSSIANNDPNSPMAQGYKAAALKFAQVAGIDPAKLHLDTASPAQIEQFVKSMSPALDAQLKIETIKQTKQLAVEGKTKDSQDKAYQDVRKNMETFRGNRAAQQASLDQYSAAKALALVKGKNPNSLTIQDLQLLSDEMAKIATGGVPGEHGVTMLMPNNLQTKWAEMKNFVLSKPTDAQAGAYIKHNMDYLTEMTKESDKVLKSFRTNILKGARDRIRPDQYQEAQQDYELGNDLGKGSNQAAAPSRDDVETEMKRRGLLK